MSVSRGAHKPSILESITEILSSLVFWEKEADISDLILTPFEALEELEKRRKDPTLQEKVEKYLARDIPEYFENGPILYLARHIVTPNFETLRFVHLIRDLGLKTVITQDSKGLFVTQNHDKRALCKLPICLRVTQKDEKLNEHYQNVTVVDFSEADGKPFGEIKTLWGENLSDFHTRLFSELGVSMTEVSNDAEWVDRHHRDNLLEHYKHLLALFVVHGIFFENYTDDEHEALFIKQVLRPACNFIEKKFGYRPIITQIFPTSFESFHYWISYPHTVLDIVRKSMHNRPHSPRRAV